MTHSPGPFFCVRGRFKHREAIFIQSFDGTFVGKVYGHGRQPVEDNARLLAAAPVLRATLHDLVEQFDVYRAGWGGSEWRDRIGLPDDLERARAALAVSAPILPQTKDV